jgi:uncharacterized phage protein (TIGR01671 family)
MKRELKFRAWDLDSQDKMYSWEEIRNLFNDHLKQERVILMQYTGIKDKNGKEIYEGDIVVESGEYVNPFDGSSHKFSRTFEVKYLADGFHLFTDQVNGEHEVISNIYENPELLKS